MMKLSQSIRAIGAREWRVGNREKRRFNALLNGYVSTKYSSIYNECREFYNSLNKEHPERHDLTKTKTFKRWRSQQREAQNDEYDESDEDNNNNTESSTLIITRPPPVEQSLPHDEDNTGSEIDGEDNNNNTEPSTSIITRPPSLEQSLPHDEDNTDSETNGEDNDQHPPQQNILAEAGVELLPGDPLAVNDAENIIDEIIRELNQDDAIRNIFNDVDNEMVVPHYTEEDEGIGLNVEIELDGIIEPLDLELEGFDF